jgi:hypothetical protein
MRAVAEQFVKHYYTCMKDDRTKLAAIYVRGAVRARPHRLNSAAVARPLTCAPVTQQPHSKFTLESQGVQGPQAIVQKLMVRDAARTATTATLIWPPVPDPSPAVLPAHPGRPAVWMRRHSCVCHRRDSGKCLGPRRRAARRAPSRARARGCSPRPDPRPPRLCSASRSTCCRRRPIPPSSGCTMTCSAPVKSGVCCSACARAPVRRRCSLCAPCVHTAGPQIKENEKSCLIAELVIQRRPLEPARRETIVRAPQRAAVTRRSAALFAPSSPASCPLRHIHMARLSDHAWARRRWRRTMLLECLSLAASCGSGRAHANDSTAGEGEGGYLIVHRTLSFAASTASLKRCIALFEGISNSDPGLREHGSSSATCSRASSTDSPAVEGDEVDQRRQASQQAPELRCLLHRIVDTLPCARRIHRPTEAALEARPP